ncbi:unnamed protein product [Rotaria sp. Silwood1]|nr:unnamed protein product [Rotaria sp. Silwood1]CAF3396950.1 unnamed protein product [Rotaria sp. Silwood1]CAF3411531.1 unnamed protein product [Rotaria sp. Silwood1]CAF4723807.1 unnamed protein product [Rotaria sp. Silwood1]
MSKSHTNQQTAVLELSLSTNADPSLMDSNHFSKYHSIEQYLTFNILGKIYYVKKSLFQNNSDLFHDTLFTKFDQLEQFYNQKRQQYVINISPVIFENILEYYRTQKLFEPSNVHIDYFKETLNKFHIDTSSLDTDQRYKRFVPRQTNFQIIHVLLEYPDSCQFSQILHYMCSMVALLSCLVVSISLTSRDPNIDLHTWNTTEFELPSRSKSIIAHFNNRSSNIFIIDTLCLVWTIVETILRILSTPSLHNYLTKLGLFDKSTLGVVFHFIYIYIIGTGTKPRRCKQNSIQTNDMFSCITFNRRVMIINLLRKVRLVRYIRPLKYFVLSLIASKREVIRLVVLILFIIAFLAPLIFIIESFYIYECSSSTHVPNTRCIRTISDAFYYLILIISTVGYGDVYPMSHLARFIAMLASPLSIMILSIPLSSIYSKYISLREIYQMQLVMPENVRYLINDDTKCVKRDHKLQKNEIIDVTEQIHRNLKRLRIN